MAIESALIPVCLPLIQFSLKQPERFVQRNRTKIIKNVSALRLGLQHTRFRSAFDDPPIIEQMRRRVELSLHLPALPSFSCPDRRLLPGAISFEGACRELAFAIL